MSHQPPLSDQQALVIFSGGQDSATCLAWALSRGQRHSVELECRGKVRSAIAALKPEWQDRLGPDTLLDISLFRQLADTALTSDMPIEQEGEGIPNTFVPGRNLLFIMHAAAWAYGKNIRHLVLGVCESDSSGYPDCRDDSIKAMQVALNTGMTASLSRAIPATRARAASAIPGATAAASARPASCAPTAMRSIFPAITRSEAVMAAKKQLTAAQGMDAACILFELNSKREHIVNLAFGAEIPEACLTEPGALPDFCAEWRAFVHATVTAGLMQHAPNSVLVGYLRRTGELLAATAKAEGASLHTQAVPVSEDSLNAFVDGPFAAYMPLLAQEKQHQCPVLFCRRLGYDEDSRITPEILKKIQARLAAVMALVITAIWDKLDQYEIAAD